MFRKRGLLPFDFALCTMTVTVYHREGLTRQVLEGVHFEWTGERSVSGGIQTDKRSFLLVVPYDCHLGIGDRICFGEGPETVTAQEAVPMCVVRSLKRRYFLGRFCHIEARG